MQGHILLMPVEWFQEISYYPALDGDARNLRANCMLTAAPDLLFSNKAKLTDLTVDLTILMGDQPICEGRGVPKEAIGCLYFNDPQAPRDNLPGMLDPMLQGWLYLKPQSYAAAWDQIRDGGYVNCNIFLKVGPVQNELPPKLWDVSQTLFIFAVSLRFTRRPLANKPSEPAQPLSAIKNASSGFWASTLKKIEGTIEQKWHA
jgi:hypothetical protein